MFPLPSILNAEILLYIYIPILVYCLPNYSVSLKFLTEQTQRQCKWPLRVNSKQPKILELILTYLTDLKLFKLEETSKASPTCLNYHLVENGSTQPLLKPFQGLGAPYHFFPLLISCESLLHCWVYLGEYCLL